MGNAIMNEIIAVQSELNRRTEIENRAIESIKQGRYEEAIEILDAI